MLGLKGICLFLLFSIKMNFFYVVLAVRGQQKIYSINVLEKRRHSYDNKTTKSQKSKM